MNKLLTPRELATFLGIAEQTIYNRHSEGRNLPPCIKLGHLLRFRQCDISDWLDGQVEHPTPPPTPTFRRAGRPTKAEEIAKRRR